MLLTSGAGNLLPERQTKPEAPKADKREHASKLWLQHRTHTLTKQSTIDESDSSEHRLHGRTDRPTDKMDE